jgi:putative flippase GtrA
VATQTTAPPGAPAPTGRTAGQIVRFALVGAVNTVVDYVTFITLTVVFSISLSNVWMAKYPSSALGMTVSFFLNRRFVFRATAHRARRQAVRFVVATLIGIFVIQNLLTQLFASKVQYFGIEAFHAVNAAGLSRAKFTLGLSEGFTIKTVAFALGAVASIVWNFLAYKYWVFRQDEDATMEPR